MIKDLTLYMIFILSILAMKRSLAQEPPKLIIRSDDIGSFSAANHAIIETYKNGITTSVELMINCPWAPEAIKLLEEFPDLDVGVHLMITSEWENVKWRPLTEVPSLVDDNGYFYSFIYPNQNVPNAAILEHNWKLEDIEKEFRAQIEMAKKLIPRVSHISTHMGCGNMHQDVKNMLAKLSIEYNLPQDYDYGLKMFPNIQLNKQKDFDAKVSAFLNGIDSLISGEVYIFVEHPAQDVSEMEHVGHEGYRNVRQDRSEVTKLLTHPKIKEKILKLGIELIDFKSIDYKSIKEKS